MTDETSENAPRFCERCGAPDATLFSAYVERLGQMRKLLCPACTAWARAEIARIESASARAAARQESHARGMHADGARWRSKAAPD